MSSSVWLCEVTVEAEWATGETRDQFVELSRELRPFAPQLSFSTEGLVAVRVEVVSEELLAATQKGAMVVKDAFEAFGIDYSVRELRVVCRGSVTGIPVRPILTAVPDSPLGA